MASVGNVAAPFDSSSSSGAKPKRSQRVAGHGSGGKSDIRGVGGGVGDGVGAEDPTESPDAQRTTFDMN